MVQKLLNSKQKILNCVWEAFKKTSVDNMKKAGLNGHVYDFSVDYDAIPVDDVLNMHKYLMKKHDMKQCLDLLKNVCYNNVLFYL